MENKTGTIITENLRNISEAFAYAVDAGFLEREHAKSIFKACLRVAGYEVPQKDIKKATKGGE